MSDSLLKILRCGMLTTVQDMGRYGYQRYGVTVSGAVDAWSLKVANMLIGNEENCAGLEITMMGPQIEFCRDSFISICGGDLRPLLDGEKLPMWEGVRVRKGQMLSFGGRISGCRAYLAVSGGIDVPQVMGSRSTFLRGSMGGFEGRPLKDGDVLCGGAAKGAAGLMRLRPGCRPAFDGSQRELRVIMGPQSHHFTEDALKLFLSGIYTVSINADRMGIRLDGDILQHRHGADILSEAVCFGSIQVPAHGRPIILLAESQTTGGYAKIAAVVTADLSYVAQCIPGDKVFFSPVTLEFARRLLMEREKSLHRGLVLIN